LITGFLEGKMGILFLAIDYHLAIDYKDLLIETIWLVNSVLGGNLFFVGCY